MFCAAIPVAAVFPAEPRADALPAWRTIATQAETELRGNILPFWLTHARDRERGGFYGLIDADLKVHERAPRGALLTSRILWTFSAAHRHFPTPEYREMAEWAFRDLLNRFWDAEHDGLVWTTAADGTPQDTRKHVYGQAFGMYSLAEYHRATGDASALEHAIQLYRAMETHARDRGHGGYFEELDRAWHRHDDIAPRRRLMGPQGLKSQNAHLHIMEAYTNLLRVWPDPQLRANLHALVEVMLTRVLNPETHHLGLFFSADWTLQSREISYGHDIEFSWLVVESAGVVNDAELLSRARGAALAIADVCLREGVDADGGMFNEAGPHGLTDANKDWWPQAEAAVGFLHAWELSHEPRYLTATERTWGFINRCLVNRAGGEWFRATNRAGEPDRRSPLASLWKCPYHNGRACLETIARVQALEAEASRGTAAGN